MSEALSPLPSVATKVISARPIISAAAVFAVRPGLRVEFSLASFPGVLPARGAERPQRGELPRPLRHRDRDRVEDDERADEERDRREREQEVLHEAEAVRD